MNRANLLRAVTFAVAVGAMGLFVVGCEGDVGVDADYPVAYSDDYPPSWYLATAQPYYYGGYPSYWWHDHWYYRGAGGRWGYYRVEPRGLYGYRAGGLAGHRYYERGGYHGGYRGGYHGGGYHGGGGHGGGRR